MNMLEAVKLGFLGFFDNILTYLLQGLAAWLFRGLGQLGITIPQRPLAAVDPRRSCCRCSGITMETLWTKLGEHIGPDRVAMIRRTIDRLERRLGVHQGRAGERARRRLALRHRPALGPLGHAARAWPRTGS